MDRCRLKGLFSYGIIVIILALPLQLILFLLSWLLLDISNWLVPIFFSFHWIPVACESISEFVGFWIFGLYLYIMNTICSLIFERIGGKEKRVELLCTLIISLVFLTFLSITREPSGFFDLNFERFFALSFLSCTMMFAAFMLITTLFNKYFNSAGKTKFFVPFFISLILGSSFSYFVWLVVPI